VPILNQYRAWLDEQRVQVLPKSPMAEAIGYALNQWQALCRYTKASAYQTLVSIRTSVRKSVL
jgi:hypothetical protein